MPKTSVVVYEKPTCSTCRVALGMLRREDLDIREVNYYETPFTKEKLRSLIRKMGIPPHDLLRKNERIYAELGLARRELREDEAIELMLEHPDLIQRPIVEKGDEAILGRPPERILEFLGLA